MSNLEMPAKEKKWHWLFEAALLIRTLSGVAEVILGVLILSASKEFFNDITTNFLHITEGAKTFAAMYILAHGILNIGLSIELYRERIWAYKTNLVILILLVIYQFYRIYLYNSKILIAVTTIDVIFIVLLWHEYKYKLKTMLSSNHED